MNDAQLDELERLCRDVIESDHTDNGLAYSAALDAFDFAANPDVVLAMVQRLRGAISCDSLLQAVHARVGNGLQISTFYPDEQPCIHIQWRRDYGDAGESDDRDVYADSLYEALRKVIEWEDKADTEDEREGGSDEG